MSKKQIIFPIIVVFLVLILAALPETVSRFYYRAIYDAWPISLYTAMEEGRKQSAALFQEHSILPFILRPGANVKFMDTQVRVNRSGIRGDELKPGASLKILALGGSTTFDTGVDNNERTWCSQLEGLLSVQYPGVQVINGGLPVYGLGANAIKYILYDHLIEPDIVLIYQGFNDMSPWWNNSLTDIRSTDYWMYRGVAARMWSGLQGGIMHLPTPPVNALTHSVFLFGAFNKRGENKNIYLNMDFAKRVADIIPEHLMSANVKMLGYLISCIKKDGAVPIFVPQSIGTAERKIDIGVKREIMNQALAQINKAYIDYCRNNNVKVIDVTSETNHWTDDYFQDGLHFNNNGAHELALLLSMEIVKDGDTARLFKTKDRAVIQK